MATEKVSPTVLALADDTIVGLTSCLRGDLIQRRDSSYDDARGIYNAMIDKHPALIAQCANAAAVIADVTIARDNDVRLAVRGGHNGAGLGTVDDGLVIDLTPMNGARVDPGNRTARVKGGATWDGFGPGYAPTEYIGRS